LKHEKGGFVADGVDVNVGLGVGDGDEEVVKDGLCVPEEVVDTVVEPVGLKLAVGEGVGVQLGAAAVPVVVQPPHKHGIGFTVAKGQ
jgi:hypothetical protein